MTNFLKTCCFKHTLTNFSKPKVETTDCSAIIVVIRNLDLEELFSNSKTLNPILTI